MLPDKIREFATQTHRGVLTTFRRNGFFWWIQCVYVAPDYRRRGVYRVLEGHVRRLAEQRGDVCGLRLYVERDNHVAQQVYSILNMRRSHYDLFEIDFDFPILNS